MVERYCGRLETQQLKRYSVPPSRDVTSSGALLPESNVSAPKGAYSSRGREIRPEIERPRAYYWVLERRQAERQARLANYEFLKIVYSVRMAKTQAVLTLRRNGQITLPADVRRRMRAVEGDVFLAEVRDDDEIVLRKKSLVDASQAYFWTDAWQRGEREAQGDIQRGRVRRFRSAKTLVADLKR